MLKKILNGICAGILICIGGSIFLAAENKVVGAVLFSVALLCICYKGYSLFTGRVGFLLDSHDKEYVSALLLGLLGNAIATIIFGYILGYACPAYVEKAATICSAKLELNMLQVLIKGAFCGILMYLAVSIYKEKSTPLAILFCIPVFILAGFEHSIADIFYFAASHIVSGRAFLFIVVVIIGNSIGALILPALQYSKKVSE